MKFVISLLLSLLLITSAAAASDSDRWLLAGTDSPNNTAWYIDTKTLKVNDNKTVTFWAKVLLNNPKYDIKEIKLKYLLAADGMQLTKMQEIGYSSHGEIIWNNNVTKTISVIPGSGPEKLTLCVENFIKEKEAAKEKKDSAAKAVQPSKAAPPAALTSSEAETSEPAEKETAQINLLQDKEQDTSKPNEPAASGKQKHNQPADAERQATTADKQS